ncbi:S41 family peptidase [Arenicella xantha]|uniref:Peptidase S41-like protein n=1 Tax=Arenicella xantha TaxID=644221 RepID=A0A395JGH4_9GAMM|nr:S41 family peptidase [Arenicella xantha]RBP48566.1 peptidase S41-like protein [Arenicella xantha]
MKILSVACATLLFCVMTIGASNASESSQTRLPTEVISSTITQVSELLTENYVYPQVAAQMRDFLNQQLLAGNYKNSHSLRELISLIESDLQKVSSDGHINLMLAEDSTDRTSNVLPKTKSRKLITAEIISTSSDGRNIGYLKINSFSGHPETKDLLISAMKSIANSDSLIIDLRENGGGDPNLVALLSSYFVEDGTPLWNIIDRNGNPTLEVISPANQEKFMGQLCILTSYKTYSAAEAFAYTLKHLDRAYIVGEATGGGAHLIDTKRVNDAIDMRVPVVRAYNPITKSNWEGRGVIPALTVKALHAKSAAIAYLHGETTQ